MEDNHHHNYAPSNGFLMGIIVGAAATLLFTTKKGREIVKELADKGFERFSEWEDGLGQEMDVVDEDDYVEPVAIEPLQLTKDSTVEPSFSPPKQRGGVSQKQFSRDSHKKGNANFRRFFKGKGSPKKS